MLSGRGVILYVQNVLPYRLFDTATCARAMEERKKNISILKFDRHLMIIIILNVDMCIIIR